MFCLPRELDGVGLFIFGPVLEFTVSAKDEHHIVNLLLLH